MLPYIEYMDPMGMGHHVLVPCVDMFCLFHIK